MSDHEHHAGVGHVVPLWLLGTVAGGLLVLTWITVAATYVDFGAAGNLAIAMFIALIKATLVALFFMHLWWDRPINAIILGASLLFVTLFIVFSLGDSLAYSRNVADFRTENPLRLENPYAPAMVDKPGESGD